MNKFYYIFVALLATAFVACTPKNTPDPKPGDEEDEQPEYVDNSKESSMVVYLGALALNGDTAIVVTDAEEDVLSGEVQMGVRGSIKCESGFRVVITRPENAGNDEFCGADQCVPGDGEPEQILNFGLRGATSADWYTHFSPVAGGDYKLTYKFINYNRTISVAVTYSYKK